MGNEVLQQRVRSGDGVAGNAMRGIRGKIPNATKRVAAMVRPASAGLMNAWCQAQPKQ